jgi:NAD(P)-dependent dehydrogenase (short-subunit alcohol dehydrogenase family)
MTKVILLTGAAGGIGSALARRLSARGDSLGLADLDQARVTKLAAELGPNTLPLPLDVRSPLQWERVLEAVWQRFGRLDVLLNNAGFLHAGKARDVSLEQHRTALEVNVMGPLTGMLAALPRFEKQGHGHILNIASMASFVPFPSLASYAASKHALRALHHTLAIEERDSPVRFTVFHPAQIETPMLADMRREADRGGSAFVHSEKVFTAEQVAALIERAIDEQPMEVVMPAGFGHAIRFGAGFPGLVRKMLIRGDAKGRRVLDRLQGRQGSA